jgi:serine/threonine protein kinase
MVRAYTNGDEPIEGYRLLEFLGRGGFGEVWKTAGPGDVEIALKIINLKGKQGQKEFRAIQLFKKLKHPHLVPITAFWLKDAQGRVLDTGDISKRLTKKPGPITVSGGPPPAELLVAMGLGEKNLYDHMQGCERFLNKPGIPPDELLRYMEGAAKAIDFLNSPTHDFGSGPHGIQHCDIKPQNILIVGGDAQVCDYGLARILGGDVRATAAAATAAYAAPECLRDGKPSNSTDQYSLAISYVELRTGSLPFDGEEWQLEVIKAHVAGKLNLSGLPESERTVIRRATSLDPAERYPSTLEMVQALRKARETTATVSSSLPPFTGGALVAGMSLVPGHRLIELIGRGGYGEVWKASAPGGKHVAIKIIRDLQHSKGKQEFKALELIKGVEHHYLMELQAFWLLDRKGNVIPDELRERCDAPDPHTLVIVSKLASKNLLQRLEECLTETGQAIPVAELLSYMRQAAEAIDYLNSPKHELGDQFVSIQHRDIKPENILLTGNMVKVGDFGLAKVVEGTEAVIHADSRGLTLAYAAPEIFEGRVTHRTDQYSLAITYVQLRTGALPFNTASSMFELIEIHRLGKLDFSKLSEAERPVLARATAVDAESRYPSCVDMVLALEEACGVRPSWNNLPSPFSSSGAHSSGIPESLSSRSVSGHGSVPLARPAGSGVSLPFGMSYDAAGVQVPNEREQEAMRIMERLIREGKDYREVLGLNCDAGNNSAQR